MLTSRLCRFGAQLSKKNIQTLLSVYQSNVITGHHDRLGDELSELGSHLVVVVVQQAVIKTISLFSTLASCNQNNFVIFNASNL